MKVVRLAVRTMHPRRAECHHVAGRDDTATRYDPRAGLLVCASCHERLTGKVNDKLRIVGTAFFRVQGTKYIDCYFPVDFKKEGCMKVFKYRLPIHGECSVPMPIGAEWLSVQNQQGAVMLWALVDESAEMSGRRFYVVMTGEQVPLRPVAFIGTVQLESGSYVVHVFEDIHSRRGIGHGRQGTARQGAARQGRAGKARLGWAGRGKAGQGRVN